MLWQIRYKYEKWYFKHHYRGKQAKIYYDKKFKTYVNPLLLEENSSSLIYVCSELVRDSLYYEYSIVSKHHHAHIIDQVFEDAYNHAETFQIENEAEFSQQELRVIHKLVERGLMDRSRVNKE